MSTKVTAISESGHGAINTNNDQAVLQFWMTLQRKA